MNNRLKLNIVGVTLAASALIGSLRVDGAEEVPKPAEPQKVVIPVAELNRATPVDFEKEILPLLKNNCLACHNQTTTKAELVLETPQTILKGGESGPAVVPGKSEESLLLKVASHQQKPRMPPKDNKVQAVNLTSDELGLIKLWIDQGAKGEVRGLGPVPWQPLPEGLNPIFAVALTPDGQFAACGRANQIFVYHLPSSQLITRLTDPELQKSALYGKPGVAHRDLVNSLAFSPDGQLLASGGYREVKLWRHLPSVPKMNLPFAASKTMPTLAASPDGKWFATGGDDHSVKLWNAATGQLVKDLPGHSLAVTSLKFSLDSTKLISGSLDKTIRLWNVADGVALSHIETPAEVNAVTWLARSGQIASGGSDNLIRIWNLPAAPAKEFSELTVRVTSLAITPDRQSLAIAGDDGVISLVDAATSKVVKTFAGHHGPVNSLSFNSDGSVLASGGADHSIQVWEVSKGQNSLKLSGAKSVSAVAVDPKGNQLAASAEDSSVVLWNLDVPAPRVLATNEAVTIAVAAVSPDGKLLATGTTTNGKPVIVIRDLASGSVVKSFTNHEGTITALAFSSDNAKLVSGSADKTARVWNLSDAKETAKFSGHSQRVSGVAFLPGDKQIISGSADHSVKLWNAADGVETKAFTGLRGPVIGVAASSNLVVAASADHFVRAWNPADGKQVYSFAFGALVTALEISPDYALLAVAGADHTVKLYRRSDGKLLQTLRGHSAPARSLAFSADNARLVSTSTDGWSLVWDAATGKILEMVEGAWARFTASAKEVVLAGKDQTLRVVVLRTQRLLTAHTNRVVRLLYSPDGTTLFSAAEDGMVRAFKTVNGELLFSANHGAAVNDLTISADGKWLASAGEDKQVRVWDSVKGEAAPKLSLGGFASAVRTVCFSPDGQRVFAGDMIGTVLVLKMSDGLVEQRFTEHAGPVRSLAVIGDKTNQVISIDQGVHRWTVWASKQLSGHLQPVTSLDSYSADGQKLLSGSSDGTVRLWDVDKGELVRKMEHGAAVTAVAARGDGKRFASAGLNNIAKLWNASDGKLVAELSGDRQAREFVADVERTVAFAKSEVAFQKANLDNAQKQQKTDADAVKKANDAKDAAEKTLAEKEEPLRQAREAKAVTDKMLAEAKDAVKQATEAKAAAEKATDDKAAQTKADAEKILTEADTKQKEAETKAKAAEKAVTDAEGPFKLAETAKANTDKALLAAFLAARKSDETVPAAKGVLETTETEQKKTEADLDSAKKISAETEKPIRTLAFSPDNLLLATAGDNQTVHTWNAENGKAYDAFKQHSGPVHTLAFVAEDRLLSSAVDQNVNLWSTTSEWALERTLGSGDENSVLADRVTGLDFSADGEWLATGGGMPSRNGEVKLWSVADGALAREFKDAHSDTVFGVAFSANGKLLASCAADKFVRIHDVATGKFVKALEGHTHYVQGVSWKRDGRLLASGGADNLIKVWDFAAGQQKKKIEGFTKEVTSVHFLEGKDEMVVTAGDNLVRLVKEDGTTVRNFEGATDFVNAAAVTPEGNIVIGGGQDSVLRVWNGITGDKLAIFEPPKSEAEPKLASERKVEK